MIKVTLIFDNKYASPLTTKEFLINNYLTEEGNEDLIYMSEIEQKSYFTELADTDKIKLEVCKKNCYFDEELTLENYHCIFQSECSPYKKALLDSKYSRRIE